MNDCLASTGVDGAMLVVLALAGLAGLVVGAVLMRRSRSTSRSRGRSGAVSGLLVLVLVTMAGGLTLAAPGAASAACPVDAPPAPPVVTTIAGTWEGIHTSVDPLGGGNYSITATITDDGSVASASVDYNLLDGTDLCTAVWTQLSRTETSVVFSESVDAVLCTDGGVVTITPVGTPPTELGYHYVVSGYDDQDAVLLPAG